MRADGYTEYTLNGQSLLLLLMNTVFCCMQTSILLQGISSVLEIDGIN